MIPSLSRAARYYALRELSRRAGVRQTDFKQWLVTFAGDDLLLKVNPGVPLVRFPSRRESVSINKVARKSWQFDAEPAVQELIPYFLVPFASVQSKDDTPLFLKQSTDIIDCTEDLLATIVLVLSRFEETVRADKDQHQRFPSTASVAHAYGFLQRPIVDEYGFAFQQLLRLLMPGFKTKPRSLRVKISHDIDDLNIPFRLRAAARHAIVDKNYLGTARDIVSINSRVEPTYLRSVRNLCELSRQRGFRSATYWKASPFSMFDSGYSPMEPRIARTIAWCKNNSVELGVHPGYETFLSVENLQREVQTCRRAFGQEYIGGRQHYLRWSPQTWLDWEKCQLAYDSTLGYADKPGFRAGTCIPYFPWLLGLDRQCDLLEIPLVLMDRTLTDYMRLGDPEIRQLTIDLFKRVAMVGGVFTLLWHNSNLSARLRANYVAILDLVAGHTNYDWESDVKYLKQDWGVFH